MNISSRKYNSKYIHRSAFGSGHLSLSINKVKNQCAQGKQRRRCLIIHLTEVILKFAV